MCFNLKFLSPLLLLAFFAACGGENHLPNDKVDVRLKGETSSCLKKVGTQISDYMESKLSQAEVEAVWQCLDGALDDFVSITAPEHPVGYPPDALARFFESFFVKREIPLPVARALMNLKRILVGGEKEFLTTEEISRLRFFITKGKSWSVRLRPHLRTLFLVEPHETRYEDFDEAFSVFRQVAFEFGLWLEGQNQVYSQEEVRELLASLNSWLDSRSRVAMMDEILESLPVFFELKSILIGGTSESMRPGEWALFMRKSVAVFQAFEIFDLKWKTNQVSGLVQDHSLQGILFALEELFRGVNTPFTRVEKLIQQATTLSWWPSSLPATGVSKGLRYFFQKFLEIDKHETQLVIDHRVSNKIGALRQLYSDSVAGRSTEFLEFESRFESLGVNENGFLHHDFSAPHSSAIKRNQLAGIYLFLHPLMTSYGRDAFNKTEFQSLFREVLDVLKGMGLLSNLEDTYGARLFREINVFTLLSDGNSEVSKAEIALYAWMALSGFSQQEWLSGLAPKDCKVNSCLLQFARETSAVSLANFPRFQSYFDSLGPEDQDLIFSQMVAACGSESLVMNFVILSYVEFFMMRFDQDQSGILKLPEVLHSYEVFGLTLEELLGSVGVAPEDTLGFFTYLFRYGYTPMDGSHFGAWIRYLNWRLYPEKWSAEADRMRLLQILSELGKL